MDFKKIFSAVSEFPYISSSFHQILILKWNKVLRKCIVNRKKNLSGVLCKKKSNRLFILKFQVYYHNQFVMKTSMKIQIHNSLIVSKYAKMNASIRSTGYNCDF